MEALSLELRIGDGFVLIVNGVDISDIVDRGFNIYQDEDGVVRLQMSSTIPIRSSHE